MALPHYIKEEPESALVLCVREELAALEAPESSTEYKYPFLIARAIQAGMKRAGLQPHERSAFDFLFLLADHAQLVYMDETELAVVVNDMWGKIVLPKGIEAILELLPNAQKIAPLVRLPEACRPDSIHSDAKLIIAILHLLREKTGKPSFITTRHAEKVLGKSHQYAAALIRILVQSTALTKVTEGDSHHAPTFTINPKCLQKVYRVAE